MARRKSSSDTPMANRTGGYDERKHRAKYALSTLKEAEAIKADKGLMRDVQRHVREDQKLADKIIKGKR